MRCWHSEQLHLNETETGTTNNVDIDVWRGNIFPFTEHFRRLPPCVICSPPLHVERVKIDCFLNRAGRSLQEYGVWIEDLWERFFELTRRIVVATISMT